MHSRHSRRQFLAGTAAFGALSRSFLPAPAHAQGHSTGMGPARLTVGRRIIEVNGKPATVFGIHQADGTAGLLLDAGLWFHVELDNQAGEPTILHWHGQTPPPDQDGVVETGYASLIAPGESWTYTFAPRSGTHWMHSHHGLQEQMLLAAPLIVRAEEDRRADVQDAIIILHDFSFRDPAEILAGLTGSTPPNRAGAMAGHETDMDSMDRRGVAEDLNDIAYDAFLANDRTLDDPLVVRTEREGRVRLRLINGATSTAFWIDLGVLEGTVIAVDGDAVEPVVDRHFPIAQGQRLDIMIRLPSAGAFPVLALREGGQERTGIILASPGAAVTKIANKVDVAAPAADLSLERRLVSTLPRAMRQPDITHRIALTGQMRPYVWSIDDRTWSNHQPLRIRQGQRVVLEMANRSRMAHPMHLHGHHFQVIGIDGSIVHGAMRDTVLVPAGSTVTVAFDADNPGRWLLHCHNLFHMATGMMTEIAYGHAG